MSDRDDDHEQAGEDTDQTADPAATGHGPDAGADRGGATVGDGGDGTGRTSAETADDRSVRTYLLCGGLLVLGILAVVATAGLYTSLSSVIDVWIGDRYRPIARAVLNFGVLCVAAAGIAVLLRRL